MATQLTCVGCAAPICPGCLVRTPVGLKCRDCTGGEAKRGRRSVPILALLAVAVLPVVVWLALRGSGSSSDDDAAVARRDLDVVNASKVSRMGEEISSGPFSFKVTQVECVGREVGTPPTTRVTQGQFCLLHITLRNVGDRPATFVGPTQLVADSSAKRYRPGVAESGPPPPPLVMSNGVREITVVNLNPGAEMQGVLIYDMPVGSKLAEFEFHHGPRTMGVKVRLDNLAS